MPKFTVVDDLLISLDAGVHEPGLDTLWLSDAALALDAGSVLVAGCGAGLIPLRIARRCAAVTAVDLNPQAVSCCIRNVHANGLGDRVTTRVADVRDLPGHHTWDLVVCNPPQLPAPAEGSRAEWVALANDGGKDGRAMIDWLCDRGVGLVAPGGALMFTHFTFLDVERTVSALQAGRLRVHVSQPFRKPLGILSGERLPAFSPWDRGDSYSLVIITARK